MITYKWNVTFMDTKPSADGLTNVVCGVGWFVKATDATVVPAISADTTGHTKLGAPSPADFTPYSELSEEIVLNWVWKTDGTQTAVEQLLAAVIAEKKAPAIVNLELPWPLTPPPTPVQPE